MSWLLLVMFLSMHGSAMKHNYLYIWALPFANYISCVLRFGSKADSHIVRDLH